MKIFSTIKDIFSIEELRNRIINTIGFILIFRIGSYILLPGVNPASLDKGDVSGMMGVIDSFLGDHQRQGPLDFVLEGEALVNFHDP